MSATKSRDDTPGVSEASSALRSVCPSARFEIGGVGGRTERSLSIYDPRSAFDLVDELAFLSERTIEPNVFYDPYFLVPAMPRLEDRDVELLVIRDEMGPRSRLRLLLPYSVERLGALPRTSMIRVWSHPFGPLGTLPLDGDDPAGTLASLVVGLRDPALGLPDVLVVPDIRRDGGMAGAISACADALGLPTMIVNRTSRAIWRRTDPASPGVRPGDLSARRRRELARGRRRLEGVGDLTFETAASAEDFRPALEDFLILEASGWKGRARSALIHDRYRAAFAREALNALAERGQARIFTLRLDGEAIASLVMLTQGPDAYAWKSAYDERFARASPGQQLMARVTRELESDPDILRADSCAVPDHFVMNRFWKGRLELGTLVVGLNADAAGRVARAARAVEKARRSANRVRIARSALGSLFSR